MRVLLKKVVTVCFLLAFVFAIPANAYASTVMSEEMERVERIGVIGIGIDNNGESVRYISTCSSGGKHNMAGHGLGYAYYGPQGSDDLRISAGTTTQCTYCDLVLITEGNPFITGATWGTYAFWNPGYQLTSNVNIMYTYDFGYSDDNNDPFVQGFNFAK